MVFDMRLDRIRNLHQKINFKDYFANVFIGLSFVNFLFAAFAICDQYRTRYGIHVSNAIMFNHESVWRPEAFVTRKISKAVAAISLGSQKKLNLWTLDPIRDWGGRRNICKL